jgi:hypothetical protein
VLSCRESEYVYDMDDRKVQQVFPTPQGEASVRYFSQCLSHRNIVLLGDPGSGKTHLFKDFAAGASGAYLPARQFLNMPSVGSEAPLFIDGLDERRGGRGDQDTIDRMVQKLFAVGPSKVRIACRVADWLGESDLAAFRSYFEGQGGVTVFVLQPLSEDEQIAVLTAREGIDPGLFIEEAKRKGLHEFLGNPQNLIMLSEVVASGSWPATRKDLYNDATRLLLAEHNPERTRSGTGIFGGEELREAAGAISAARLISDIEGVSLASFGASVDFPSYRSLTFCDKEKILAALTRRCFVASSTPETVTYAHRTVAEYLAAEWLASRLRNGLPLRRLVSLLGIDARPAPELRGLNAWLAVMLPEQAHSFIDSDPYGVLTYGDAASLAPSARAHLLRALDLLSKKDPWFRSGNWSSQQLGALSGPDMVASFRAILARPDANFGIRSLVVDAIEMGRSLPELEEDLATVVARRQSTFAERVGALQALLKLGDAGRIRLAGIFRSGLGSDSNGIRLRAQILYDLYDEGFGPADVLSLLTDLSSCEYDVPFGVLREVASRMAVADVCAVLDGFKINEAERPIRSERHNRWEISGFLEHALLRILRSDKAVTGSQLWKWLRDRRESRDVYSGSVDDLKTELRRRRDLHPALIDAVLETAAVKSIFLLVSRFREATLNAVDEDDLIEAVERHFLAAESGTERQIALYHLGMNLSYRCTEKSVAVFDRLFAAADAQPHLLTARNQVTIWIIEDWRIEDALERQRSRIEEEVRLAKTRADFAKAKAAIGAGEDRDWLAYLGELYLTERDTSPREAVAAVLGEENRTVAFNGLTAFLKRKDMPSFDELLAVIAEQKYCRWWFALIAGMDEAWAARQSLCAFGDHLLQIGLAIDLVMPTMFRESASAKKSERPWKQAAFKERTELALGVYMSIARTKLAQGAGHIDGLHDVLHEQAFGSARPAVVEKLLTAFPNAARQILRFVLESGVACVDRRGGILELAKSVRDGTISVDPDRCDLWIAAGYVIDPCEFREPLLIRVAADSSVIWDLRDLTRFDHGKPGTEAPPLSIVQLRELALMAGKHFPNCRRPGGVGSGNQNQWDGSEYVHGLVNQLSASPAEAATQALRELAQHDAMQSYLDDLNHALANQEERRRIFLYRQPAWDEMLKTLSNGPPANTADLHALILDHMADLAKEIGNANTDMFKRFWNEDSYRRIVDPKPEESCRDALVDLLKPRLSPLGLHVEPEGHLALDKRADMAVFGHEMKIVIELKRDYHAEVWAAVGNQLDRLYTRDSQSQGHGVYGVFWFGPKRPSNMPLPPCGARPVSAADMAQKLTEIITSEKWHKIAAVVLDVSGEIDG